MQFSILFIGALAAIASTVSAASANLPAAAIQARGLPGCAEQCFTPHSTSPEEIRAKCADAPHNQEVKKCVQGHCRWPHEQLATLNYAKGECKNVGAALQGV